MRLLSVPQEKTEEERRKEAEIEKEKQVTISLFLPPFYPLWSLLAASFLTPLSLYFPLPAFSLPFVVFHLLISSLFFLLSSLHFLPSVSFIFLSHSLLPLCHVCIKSSTCVSQEYRKKILDADANQKLGLLIAAIRLGDWPTSLSLISHLPPLLPSWCSAISQALFQLLHFLLEPLYRM